MISPLPWLLDWPPSRVAIAVFLLATAFSVGTLIAFDGVVGDDIGDGNVTVHSTDLTVRLNDEFEFPDTGGDGVQTCLGVGTPGDRINVVGAVTVHVPYEGEGSDPDSLTVLVSLAHTEETTTTTVEGTGNRTADVFWLLEDDETLSVGDTATVQIRVRDGDATLASANRSVPVVEDSRRYEC